MVLPNNAFLVLMTLMCVLLILIMFEILRDDCFFTRRSLVVENDTDRNNPLEHMDIH